MLSLSLILATRRRTMLGCLRRRRTLEWWEVKHRSFFFLCNIVCIYCICNNVQYRLVKPSLPHHRPHHRPCLSVRDRPVGGPREHLLLVSCGALSEERSERESDQQDKILPAHSAGGIQEFVAETSCKDELNMAIHRFDSQIAHSQLVPLWRWSCHKLPHLSYDRHFKLTCISPRTTLSLDEGIMYIGDI